MESSLILSSFCCCFDVRSDKRFEVSHFRLDRRSCRLLYSVVFVLQSCPGKTQLTHSAIVVHGYGRLHAMVVWYGGQKGT
jgi:hypothetical protein